MTRTITANRNEFTVPQLGSVIFQDSPNTHEGINDGIKIIFPVGSQVTTGLHWHETHTEYISISQGAARVEINGLSEICTSKSGIIKIPVRARHQYMWAGRSLTTGELDTLSSEIVDELRKDLVLTEWTHYPDGRKEVFFRQVVSLVLERKGTGIWETLWMLWSFFVVFHSADNYPVFINGPRMFQSVVTHSVLWIAAYLGGFVGLKGWYEEYTPEHLIQGLGNDERIVDEVSKKNM